MIPKEFDAISKADIEALVANAIAERRTIEYKAQLPSDQDEARKEFLCDASSFANAIGGDLIFGIRDKPDANGQPTGIPEAANGLAGINVDAEIRRLESMLRDGLDERVPGVRIKSVDGFPSGSIIILRIPQSWASPHMVKFRNLSRFFSRTSAGRYQLDVREIRAAVLASETLSERITAFRAGRVGKIMAGEPAAPLDANPKIIVHLLPLQSFSRTATVNLIAAQGETPRLLPMGRVRRWDPARFNFNGLIICAGARNGPPTQSYVQLFRNGVIEAVCAHFSIADQLLVANWFENWLVEAIPRYLEVQNALGVGPPVFIALSIVGARGYKIMFTNPQGQSLTEGQIESDVLPIQEVLMPDAHADLSTILRPALDTIWQAAGWQRSFAYDDNGKRVQIPDVV